MLFLDICRIELMGDNIYGDSSYMVVKNSNNITIETILYINNRVTVDSM